MENYRHSWACHKAHLLSPQGDQELSQGQDPECEQSKVGGFREVFVCADFFGNLEGVSQSLRWPCFPPRSSP